MKAIRPVRFAYFTAILALGSVAGAFSIFRVVLHWRGGLPVVDPGL